MRRWTGIKRAYQIDHVGLQTPVTTWLGDEAGVVSPRVDGWI